MVNTIIDFEERRLEKLPPEELSRTLMQMPVKRRLEVILQRPDAEAVVAAMPDEDFYFSIQEIGPHDAMPLLALAQIDQLNHLFDLEWWRKDSIQPAKAVDWLERLARASEDRLLAWIYQADFDLLVSLFKRWISAAVAPEDIDPVEAVEQLPKNTLDDLYYWDVRYPQYEELIKRLLGLFFEVNYSFYKELMNSILWAVDVEVEEQAYRLHKGRLEDHAIPDFYDALEIYRSIRVEEMAHNKETFPPGASEAPPPTFALALIPEGDLLSRALREIRDAPLFDTLQMELASIANKAVVADQIPADEPEALRRAVDKAAAGVNLGLEIQSSGDLKIAARNLREVFLEQLFRLGHTQVSRLRTRMQRVMKEGWLARWPAGLKVLEPEWMDAAEALLGRTPRLLVPAKRHEAPLREGLFRTPRDLLQGKHLIDIIEALGRLFNALKPDPEALRLSLWEEGQIRNLQELTLGAMIWTAEARFRLDGRWTVDPLPVRLWTELFPKLEPPEMEAAIRARVEELFPESSSRLLIEAYLTPLFQTYAEEMAPFGKANPPDPMLVTFFAFSDAK